MKSQFKIITVTMVLLCVSMSIADTFRHKETGDVFVGFPTQKVASGKTLVYNSDEGKIMPVVLSDYEITSDSKGRRDLVPLFLLNKPEILISPKISKTVADAIIETSNKGPQAIVLQIDEPGGRGDVMKTVSDAILQTSNCPVIAYISEGAYSAAAVIAIACDKVYIKSTGVIGAVGPVIKGAINAQDDAEYLSTYNLNFQLNDFLYATTVAQKNERPELLTRALIDLTTSVIEVNNLNGSKDFIEEKNRQATQTLVRTLCEGVSSTDMDSLSTADLIGKVLNLTASEAVELGLVDDTAESVEDVLSKEGFSSAKVSPVSTIEKQLKKFSAAQRSISQGLYRIDQYERNIETLSDQFTTIDDQLRTSTQTREVSRGDAGYLSSRRRQTYLSSYQNQDVASSRRSRDNRDNLSRSQTVTTQEPRVNIQIVYNQLVNSLRNAVAEYRRVLNTVDRWPGALPAKISKTMLQNDMNSAASELDRLYLYQPAYPVQNQQQIQQERTTGNRR